MRASLSKVTTHYATLRATVCSNRSREPIRNALPLNSAFNWFPPKVTAISCTKSYVVTAFMSRPCTLLPGQWTQGKIIKEYQRKKKLMTWRKVRKNENIMHGDGGN